VRNREFSAPPGALTPLTSDTGRIASRVMRITLDIDPPILKEVKAIQKQERRCMGSIVSELLAEALAHRRSGGHVPFRWILRQMNSVIDVADNEAVYPRLDRERG
jgi:hypothetical protein